MQRSVIISHFQSWSIGITTMQSEPCSSREGDFFPDFETVSPPTLLSTTLEYDIMIASLQKRVVYTCIPNSCFSSSGTCTE